MDGLQHQQADPSMLVLFVVPGGKRHAESTGVFGAAETFREFRSILEGLELRFRKRIVVVDMWPVVGLGDAQIGTEQSDGF